MSITLQAQETPDTDDPFARFGNFDEASDLVIDHEIWSTFLNATVIVIDPSAKTMSSTKNSPRTGTRISRGSKSPARFESNRVLFHLLKEEDLVWVTKYIRELVALPNHFPLSDFSSDEQLAYWFNLYNALVYEQVAIRYPISKLEKIRLGRNNRASLWDVKLVTIEGVALSLNDIQNNILIRHWKSPMVLYGLYQGSIGGPSLPSVAFTSENIRNILNLSAREFVNSNRGVRMQGTEARVSLIYDWGKAAFPDWDADVASHLRMFANTTLGNEIANSNTFTADLYDWSIADTNGGTLSAGPKHSTAANLLNQGPNDTISDVDFAFINQRGPYRSVKGGLTQMGSEMMKNGLIVPGALDAEMASLLKEMARRRDMSKPREGVVSSQECGTDDCPENPSEDTEGNEGGLRP